MYIAQTTDSRHSLVPYHDEEGNVVAVAVYEGTVPQTGKEPLATYRFTGREARDFELGLQDARLHVEEAANAA